MALLARSVEFTSELAKELDDAIAVSCDVTDETSVAEAFLQIRQILGEVEVLVYNAGSGHGARLRTSRRLNSPRTGR